MPRSTNSQVSSLATMRTWREDALVLAALLVVALLGIRLFTPAQPPAPADPVETPVITDVPEEPAVPIPTPTIADVPSEPVDPIDPNVYRDFARPNEQPVSQDRLIPTGGAFITLFGTEDPERMWYVSNHDNPSGFWRNDFREANVQATVNGLSLSITDKDHSAARPWDGSELGTNEKFGYGRYEVVMAPAKGSGLISSFFTYTGPYFGDPHDEIDIEFLGKNTRRVELNMFKNGRATASKVVELPFDAADALHLYAFEWRPDEIVWLVDGLVLHRVSAKDYQLPSHPGKIMMNVWTGKASSWHGQADFQSGTAAEYACVSYRPFGVASRACSDFYRPQLYYRSSRQPD